MLADLNQLPCSDSHTLIPTLPASQSPWRPFSTLLPSTHIPSAHLSHSPCLRRNFSFSFGQQDLRKKLLVSGPPISPAVPSCWPSGFQTSYTCRSPGPKSWKPAIQLVPWDGPNVGAWAPFGDPLPPRFSLRFLHVGPQEVYQLLWPKSALVKWGLQTLSCLPHPSTVRITAIGYVLLFC